MSFRTAKVGLLVPVLLLVACSTIPVNELTQYREAFAHSKDASEQVLLDLDQTFKASESIRTLALGEKGETSPYSSVWSAVSSARASGLRDDIETRRKALEVVSRYNDALAALAEGKSIATIGNSVSGLATSVSQLRTAIGGSAIPGLSSLTGVLTTLLEQAEKARQREEFIKAVKDGRPIVEKIFAAFIADIESHYNMRASLANRERIRLIADMRASQRAVAGLVAANGFSMVDIAKIKQRADKAFSALTEPAPALQPLAPGAAVLSDVVRAQVQDELEKLDAAAIGYRANVQRMLATVEMLREYEALLRTTDAALLSLAKALDAPQPALTSGTEILTLAFNVRRQLAELRAVGI